MRKRFVVLAAAVATSLAIAAPALAHPVQPPGRGGETVTSAGGLTPAHGLGLACAENRSPAIGFLPLDCLLGVNAD